MKIYTINKNYIDYLKTYEPKVPNHDYRGVKPYIGIVLEIEGIKYYAPLTSQKANLDRIPSHQCTLFKLFDRNDSSNKLGAIQLRFMIPVIDSQITLLDMDAQNERYKRMLYKQYEFIKIHTEEIRNRANKLHRLVTVSKNDFYCCLSCNFTLLEANYLSFDRE